MHKMTLNRAGVILVKTEQGTCYQCVVKGHTTYYYRAIMTFVNPHLDPRGFLADHGEIDSIVKKFYEDKSIPSCELMVQEIAEMLSNFLTDSDMKPDSVFVEITNIPNGSQGYINTTYYPVNKA